MSVDGSQVILNETSVSSLITIFVGTEGASISSCVVTDNGELCADILSAISLADTVKSYVILEDSPVIV